MSKSKHKSKEIKSEKPEKPAKAPKAANPKKKASAPESRKARKTGTVKSAEEKPKKSGIRKPSVPKKKATSSGGITQDDIALRAYYIGEERRRTGAPGSSHGDWLEAERQLRAENSAG